MKRKGSFVFKYLWLFIFPLLYLPETLFQGATGFGTLTVSDIVMLLYIPALLVAMFSEHRIRQLQAHDINQLIVIFIWWAVISTLLIPLRYTYSGFYFFTFGLLKIAKFSLYLLAAWLTIRVISHIQQRQRFLWALLAGALITSFGLLLSREDSPLYAATVSAVVEQAYKDNAIALVAAILFVVILGLWLDQRFTAFNWQRAASVALPIILLGMILARGRGAWFAAFVGSAYLLIHFRKWRVLIVVVVGISLLTMAYTQIDVFRHEVDKTLFPDPIYLERYDAGLGGVDVGGRSVILLAEITKILDAPLLGRGLFHRGGQSGIYSTGSHNFFLQMFLEVGIIGGGLILLICRSMWKSTGHHKALCIGLSAPVRAALLTAFVGGLSGEYFYGGLPLLTILVVWGLVGSLPGSEKIAGAGTFSAVKFVKTSAFHGRM